MKVLPQFQFSTRYMPYGIKKDKSGRRTYCANLKVLPYAREFKNPQRCKSKPPKSNYEMCFIFATVKPDGAVMCTAAAKILRQRVLAFRVSSVVIKSGPKQTSGVMAVYIYAEAARLLPAIPNSSSSWSGNAARITTLQHLPLRTITNISQSGK